MSRPSDGMTLDELRDEFDWMFEFESRMAERICEDADVHNLVDYVTGLEVENAKLREERDHWHVEQVHAYGNWEDAYRRAAELDAENAKLRELARAAWGCIHSGLSCYDCRLIAGGCTLQTLMRELGIEGDG